MGGARKNRGGETVARMCCMREESIFTFLKTDSKLLVLDRQCFPDRT